MVHATVGVGLSRMARWEPHLSDRDDLRVRVRVSGGKQIGLLIPAKKKKDTELQQRM